LEDVGIHTLIHYPVPPHLQRAYSELGLREESFPISEKIHREVLSLPIGPQMTSLQVQFVSQAINTFAR
jgi:dTDP-4-amino-4,6-dideoxygalactose transaminase